VSKPAALPAENTGSGLQAVPTIEDPSIFDEEYDDYSQRYSRRRSHTPLIIGVVLILLVLLGGILFLVSQKKDPEAPTSDKKPGVVAKAPAKKATPPAAPAAEPAAAEPADAPTSAEGDKPAPSAKGGDTGKKAAPAPPAAAKADVPKPPAGASPGAKPGPSQKKPGQRVITASGGKEEDLPDFNYIPPGSRAVHYEKSAEPLDEQPDETKPDEVKPDPVKPPPSEDKPAPPPKDPPPPAAPPAKAPPVAAAPEKGSLILSTTPWAYISIDGKATGRSTPVTETRPLKLSPGKHKVTFVKDGQKFTFPVTIKAGKTTSLVKKLDLKKEGE